MHIRVENSSMDLLSIKPTDSRPSLSSLWSLHVHLQKLECRTRFNMLHPCCCLK
ncbi:Uncharacterized protein BM_BM13011 [Brugia malayi]|uniref:Bm13011 n=1 Tax=Brugia malayi TaxID=6279 RepID=A0A0J9XLS7_BRUMA|nr:Uncharacterized protein BM_BM13011 [Brugia malayi]CDP90762.1 Bm13011 [Brugia malayi]VIO87170.1 Uncharacterized protein BM_BM13011 [Brugia malayi]